MVRYDIWFGNTTRGASRWVSHSLTTWSFATDAFVQAMEKFGFPGLSAFDIVNTGKQVREEIAATDPEKAAGL